MSQRAVQDRFAEVVAARPNAPAISGRGRTLSYAGLDAAAGRLAQEIVETASGLAPLVCIGCVDPFDYVTALLATFRAGGIAFPLDAATPDKRTEHMIRVARPNMSIVDGPFAERLERATPPWLQMRMIAMEQVRSGDGGAHSVETLWPPVQAKGEDPCYLFFTSGSTGEPKGILGQTKGVSHFVDWEIRTFEVGPHDAAPMLASPAFDAVLRDIFTPLCAGGRICVTDDRGILTEPEALIEWLAASGVTFWHTTPSVLRRVLACAPGGRLPALRRVMTSGEALLPIDVQRWFEAFQDRAELVNFYGPSETTMIKLFHRVTRADAARARVPIGKPIEGCRAIVLDEAGTPAGVGMVGEIYIRTPYRSLGYINRPELTKMAFVPNPLSGDPSDVVYRTGDLGRMTDEGVFEFLGRRDQQVKIRGVRVELAEVEGHLRRHEAIFDVAVVDHESEEGETQLCAYMVLAQHASVAEIREYLATLMPEPMIPTLYVPLDRIPRTTTGKLDRSALPDARQAVSPGSRELTLPRTPIEEAIADIWKELLEIDPVDIRSSFFTMGGHSLLAMQVISRVEACFGVDLPLQDFLVTPTIENLAAILETTLLARAAVDQELQELIEGAARQA